MKRTIFFGDISSWSRTTVHPKITDKIGTFEIARVPIGSPEAPSFKIKPAPGHKPSEVVLPAENRFNEQEYFTKSAARTSAITRTFEHIYKDAEGKIQRVGVPLAEPKSALDGVPNATASQLKAIRRNLVPRE